MGGGDLNLKKSWHPRTMKNQEKVWKAEQKQLEEEKKIKELQRRLKEEQLTEHLENLGERSGQLKKKNADLNWMYKGPGGHVSREDYLLGRKVDKSFELLVKEESKGSAEVDDNKSSHVIEHEINPQSVIEKGENNVQVDMKRKVLEDPLLAIRKTEIATKSAITSNPVKMKQLSLLISTLKSKNKKSARSKSSGKKKKNKNSKKKLKKMKKTKRKRRKKESSSSHSSSSTSDSESEDSSSDIEPHDVQREIQLSKSKNRSENWEMRRKDSYPPDNRQENFNRSAQARRGLQHEYQPHLRPSDDRERHRLKNRKHTNERSRSARTRDRSPVRRRGSEGENESSNMEEMRRRMMQNATERDEQRKANVRRYEREREEESKREDKYTDALLRNVGSSTMGKSVESRIRSKVSSSQRMSGHMSESFLKK